MVRWPAFVLVLGALGALAPACAANGDGERTPSAAITPGEGDGGAVDPSCAACPEGYVCSAGKCVAADGDSDGDGYPVSNDCDDGDPSIHPGAKEVCNGKDDNCDGRVDEGFDADGDGYPTCDTPGKAADCDDTDPAVNPGAKEVCNGKDDNCDSKIDEGFDADNDGYYACEHGTLQADCDDKDPAVHPGASETCNGKDSDCNGKIDDLPATLNGSLSIPIDPHWKVSGNASFAQGWAQLTPDAPSQGGALWWSATYLFDNFDMSAKFWIQAKPNGQGADGFSFAWVPGNNVNAVGLPGAGYGVNGLGGFAIAIDIYQNPGEPTAPFIAVYDATSGTSLSRTSIPEVRNATEHILRVKLTAAKVSVWVDGINYLFDFPIPGYTPFTGHWGFTGGTGGLSSAQWVKDVTMHFPDGQGCIP